MFRTLIILLLIPIIGKAQNIDVRIIDTLCLQESSGLVLFEQYFVTIEDSGNDPLLHIIDTNNICNPRSVLVSNATNADWESLTFDDTFLYIGDFGNNNGTRKDLCIYKVKWSDLLVKDTVSSDKINFSYSNQHNFSKDKKNIFNCEAMIKLDSSLWLFSKSPNAQWSYVYEIPSSAKTISVHPRDSILLDFKITGACYESGILRFIGYDFKPKTSVRTGIFAIEDLNNKKWSSSSLKGYSSIQTEAVFAQKQKVYYTSERFSKYGFDMKGEIGTFDENLSFKDQLSNCLLYTSPSPRDA